MQQHTISTQCRPYASAHDHPQAHGISHRGSHKTQTITRANMGHVHALLEGGESLDTILHLLNTASNAAIMRITSANNMLGRHREDFRIRAQEIIQSRRR